MCIMPLSHVKAVPTTALLCIDDDQDVLECEKAFLEAFGYTVVTASSGREGLELAGLRSFDVVIVDYCMAEMNGQEFATAMRRLRPLAPIIMLSGMDVPGQALKVVDAFVPKDRLASRYQPSHYCVGAESLSSSSNDAYRGKSVHSKRPIKGAIGTLIWHDSGIVPVGILRSRGERAAHLFSRNRERGRHDRKRQ